MSDDDRDIDIESDDDNDDSDSGTLGSHRHASTANFTQAEKRAHHNALERKRRDHIKESFTNLREAVPTLKGEKASRAQILKKTTECIQVMRRKISESQKDVDDLKKQNAILDAQIRLLAGSQNGFAIDSVEFKDEFKEEFKEENEETDSEFEDLSDFNRRNKKLKTFHA